MCNQPRIISHILLRIANCIVNISSCLRRKSSNINVFIWGFIPRDEGWSVNRILIKDVNRILVKLCLKQDFSFIDQSNGWTLSNGDLGPSLFFRDPLQFIESENIKLPKLIINSKALINNTFVSSNTGEMCSYSDTCKSKDSVYFALKLNEAGVCTLSPPVHVHKCKHRSCLYEVRLLT